MSRQRISRVYLFAQGRDAQYIPTGVLSFGDDHMYRFGYAKSWLASRDAFPIDPINLPLTDATYRDQYLWSCFDDAMPDNWGKRVILSIHQDQPQNKLEWLLASRGSGAGMIAASASQNHPPKILRVAAFDDLAVLMEAAREIEQGSFDSTAFPPELIKLLQHGSSMGGARPKVTVEKYGREWIAKFSRKDDVFNQVRAEKACMEMARSAGCQVPELSLVDISGHTALLIERFDRSNDGRRLHYLSANAILNIHKARPGQLPRPEGRSL